ncbi:maleate cis-trans isomerase family protein [Bisbaumannia pacifica]|uniref:Asp/Glu/hydantoin racemase n=1 Tax=Bisbaumannia pacifica TaxID=77098 RepID=A0A510XDB5_9GAMM|nr:aspartate/glutamate racemase family protein [Halomonas pacifica]MBH8581865.1 aspartate/glutamate racemase family protein [Halomonas pacifica]GEK48525.1 Asp/Glu/hydantoin racemase [Halomonas pacifica]
MNRTLLGMLTPSSNTVLEPYTAALLAGLMPEVTAHFQRFTVKEISLSDRALAQFDPAPLLEAATLLNDARMNVIAWNGTSASWLGFDSDRRLCAAITEATGVPATSSVLALNEVLERTGVTRLGLVTPYLSDIQAAIVANYAAEGIEVVAERHLDDRGNFSFSEYDEATLADLVREVAKGEPEAITLLCTNLRGAGIVAELEQELGIPIYDSVSVTVWKCLTLAGLDPARISGWGGLFQDPRLAA